MNSSLNYQYQKIQNFLFKKYNLEPEIYNNIIISRLLFNQKYHYVSLFKDFLIYDDPGEFFKRFYSIDESINKIKTYCEFYEKNSKIFPNYIILPESKFIFKNIKKKQKKLNSINEKNLNINEKEKEKNSDRIFSNTIINSILSEKSSATVSNERSIKKLLKKIYDNDNELELSNCTQSRFIELNNSKIDYSLSNINSNKHRYKKFIKNFKNGNKVINNGLIKYKEYKMTKKNFSGLNKAQILRKTLDINNNNILNQNNKKKGNKINKTNNKNEEKSKSKNKDYLTERNNKSHINSTYSLKKKKETKPRIENKNFINQNKKTISQISKQNKKEAKSMPKLSSILNKNNGINKISFKNINNNNSNKKKINKQSKIINNIITNNNNTNHHTIKSYLKFNNIKLQKPVSNLNIKIKFHNVPLSNYISKHIPSLHISLNTNFKNMSTLSKSKSKSKSNSKSKSKSPNSTSNSLNKKFQAQNTIKNFNKNIKFISNNIRSIIHKDILFYSSDGLQTERIKYKNNSRDSNNSNNINKIYSINKISKNSFGNSNNKNHIKKNSYNKLVSSTPEYRKINSNSRTEREKNLHLIRMNNSKIKRMNGNIGIIDSNENKIIFSDSCSSPNTNLNGKNQSIKNNNITFFKCYRDNNINTKIKNNNLLYYTSNNYTNHPIKKINNFEKIENKSKTIHQK